MFHLGYLRDSKPLMGKYQDTVDNWPQLSLFLKRELLLVSKFFPCGVAAQTLLFEYNLALSHLEPKTAYWSNTTAVECLSLIQIFHFQGFFKSFPCGVPLVRHAPDSKFNISALKTKKTDAMVHWLISPSSIAQWLIVSKRLGIWRLEL